MAFFVNPWSLVHRWFHGSRPGQDVLTPGMVMDHAPPMDDFSWSTQVALWCELLARFGQTPRLVRHTVFVTAKAHPASRHSDPFDPLAGALIAPASLTLTKVVLQWKDHQWNPDTCHWEPLRVDGRFPALHQALVDLLPHVSAMPGIIGNVQSSRLLSRREARHYRLGPVDRLFPPVRQWIDMALESLGQVHGAGCLQARLDGVLPGAPRPVVRRL
jgi:hypothetical protein